MYMYIYTYPIIPIQFYASKNYLSPLIIRANYSN